MRDGCRGDTARASARRRRVAERSEPRRTEPRRRPKVSAVASALIAQQPKKPSGRDGCYEHPPREREPDAEHFELTMPPRALRPIIERVYWSAIAGLNNAPDELTEECLANLNEARSRARRCWPDSPTSSWTPNRSAARRRQRRERDCDPNPEPGATWSGDPREAPRASSHAADRGGPTPSVAAASYSDATSLSDPPIPADAQTPAQADESSVIPIGFHYWNGHRAGRLLATLAND